MVYVSLIEALGEYNRQLTEEWTNEQYDLVYESLEILQLKLERKKDLKNLSVNYLRTSCFIFSGSLCRFSLPYHSVRLQKSSLPAEKSDCAICTYLIYVGKSGIFRSTHAEAGAEHRLHRYTRNPRYRRRRRKSAADEPVPL